MEMSHEGQVAMDRVSAGGARAEAEALMESGFLKIEPLQQTECMLYSKIPAEIRTRIFTLALREYEDKSKPYLPNRVYYRPGYHYYSKQDTRLLQTCRLIYQEARLMPVALAELVYWHHGGPWYNRRQRAAAGSNLSGNMKVWQVEAIDTIHLYVQQKLLEDCTPFRLPITCKRLKITLRRSDWWSWQSDVNSEDKLGICPWHSGRTTSKEMEDEPRDQDLRQRGSELEWDGELRESTWIGVADEQVDGPFAGDIVGYDSDQDSEEDVVEEKINGPLMEMPMRTYYVVYMTWHVRKSAVEEVGEAAAVGPK